MVEFAYLTKEQYFIFKKLFMEYTEGMEEDVYINHLRNLSKENKKGIFKAVLLEEGDDSSGNTICICPTKIHLPIAANIINKDMDSVYVMNCSTNPSDFELPIHLVSIFRSYPWPFVNNFDNSIIELFRKTYTGKGLNRNCTYHEGNFEMIGERNSKQSTGSLLMLGKDVDKHQYFRENINLTLVPHARGIMNRLMRQAIYAGYTSGELLMNYYKQKLLLRNETDLCYNSILTQNNFHNSVHIDKRSILSNISQSRIQNDLIYDLKKESMVFSNRYITTVLEYNQNKLPKSTTCCWVLSKKYDDIHMYQYFVSPQYLFALDLSSDNAKSNKGIGATFMSSMFFHCTTIPIWKDNNGNIHLKGPGDMYNLAWGSNGTNKEKNCSYDDKTCN